MSSAHRRPVLLAWSGGKDSTLALAALRDDLQYRVVGLMTTVSRTYDRISIHGVRRSILQEAAWSGCLAAACARLGPVEHLACGDLYLEDIRRFREGSRVRGWAARRSFPCGGLIRPNWYATSSGQGTRPT